MSSKGMYKGHAGVGKRRVSTSARITDAIFSMCLKMFEEECKGVVNVTKNKNTFSTLFS